VVSVEWCWLLTIGADGEGISMKLMAGWWSLGPEAIITIVSSGNIKMQEEKKKKRKERKKERKLPFYISESLKLSCLLPWLQYSVGSL